VGNETITDAGINCKHAHGKKLEMNLIADANKLNEIANSYIEQSQNNFSPDKQLLFQELDVARIDCWVVAYAFRGKDYWMLSYGANYELVTGESPLSEIVEDFWVKAYKAANVYNYFGSLLMYKKAYAMKSADLGTSISESVIELEEKMQEPYDFGVTFGMLLALLFGSFGVYTYFSEVNYVLGYVDFINKPSSFLYAYQAWAMVLVYWGFCGLSSVVARKIFEGKMQFVPVAALRFGIGIAVVFGISVLSFVILAALNALGIGILASFVVWAFVKLLWLVKFIVVLIIAIVIWIFDIIATVISWF
jgi:hypothetical protein